MAIRAAVPLLLAVRSATARSFPDSTGKISLLVDQLPGDSLSSAQRSFVASHFVGSQKLFVPETRALRKLNPDFIMLHYHLAIWQTASNHPLVINGTAWGNDYPLVNEHDSWFWRNTTGGRVVSTSDGKWLMNLTDPGFAEYWLQSLIAQVYAGEYDGIFFDSASPPLIQGETVDEPRLKGTGVKDASIPELGGVTYIAAWEAWISTLDVALKDKGIPLIPNYDNFGTSWDTTNYSLTEGTFSEGFASAGLASDDWERSTNQILQLASQHKILVLQDYLKSGSQDIALRQFYIGNYLLVKGDPSATKETTYLCYFAKSPLEWYPEWDIALGKPLQKVLSVADLKRPGCVGIYQRAFELGLVLVNPTKAAITVSLDKTMHKVTPTGGGTIQQDGSVHPPGNLTYQQVSNVDVPASSAAIMLDKEPDNCNKAVLKTDDRHANNMHYIPLYTLWTHSVPAPPGFTSPGPHVYNTSLLDAVATIAIATNATTQTATTGEADTFTTVRGFFDTHTDGSSWIVFRYSPMQLGAHVISLSINGQQPVTACGSNCRFTAIANPNQTAGYVQVATNKQHFVTSGYNHSYFGVGENLAWAKWGGSAGIHGWAPYIQNLSSAGANYIRVWLTDGGWDDMAVETELGNYSLTNTDNIDELLALAEANGIKVLMCTESFNFFCSKPKPTPCNWDGCVYNEKNGGFLSSAADFFTSERAKSLYKQRLQYLVSRYAHSPAVFAWEFFNEIDIVDGYAPARIAQWTREMARYLRSIDIYQHPISTSFCCQEPPEVWNLKEMDFVMVHTYSRHNRTDMADNSQYETVKTARMFGKPTFVAETGEQTTDNHRFPADPKGIGLHNALWASMTSMGAMSSAVWWWDSWVAAHDLYHHFTAARKFADSVDWPAYVWRPIGHDAPPECTDTNPDSHNPPKYSCAFQKKVGKCDGHLNSTWMLGMCCKTCHPESLADCQKCSARGKQGNGGHVALPVGSGARAYGMTGSRGEANATASIIVLWIQNTNSTFAQLNASMPTSQVPELNEIEGLKLDLHTVAGHAIAGNVIATFVNTSSGKMVPANSGHLKEGLQCQRNCMLEVPNFKTDIAVIVNLKLDGPGDVNM